MIAELEARFAELEKQFGQHMADANVLLGAKNEVQNLLAKAKAAAVQVEQTAKLVENGVDAVEQVIDTSPASNN